MFRGMPSPSRVSPSLLLIPLVIPLSAASLVGCGDDDPIGGAGGAGGGGTATSSTGAGTVTELRPSASPLPGHDACVVTITTDIPVAGSHVELCTEITYPTNPPSGGPHWPRWAAFATYDAPLRREVLVHDLEHGAIAMLHDCDGCSDQVLAAFQEVTLAHGADEKCIGGGSIARFVVAPDPALDHPVALAAWGATYVATCIDVPSLKDFVAAHYAGAPEDTCADGVDPATLTCP
jgi:hypothetical protein